MNYSIRQIDDCIDMNEKYNRVISYMENEGISFKLAQNDHIKNKYRIMTNGSSIFIYKNYYKLNLCEEDKFKIEKIELLTFEPLYSNKTQLIRDKVRPWTCKVESTELLYKVVECLVGKTKEIGINVPREPKGYEGDKAICPNCNYIFKKAVRCPDCGQLIKYNDISVDFEKLFIDVTNCSTKAELVEACKKQGIVSHTKSTGETKNGRDQYLTFKDEKHRSTHLHIKTNVMKLYTFDDICKDKSFENYSFSVITSDGARNRVSEAIPLQVEDFEKIVKFFLKYEINIVK